MIDETEDCSLDEALHATSTRLSKKFGQSVGKIRPVLERTLQGFSDNLTADDLACHVNHCEIRFEPSLEAALECLDADTAFRLFSSSDLARTREQRDLVRDLLDPRAPMESLAELRSRIVRLSKDLADSKAHVVLEGQRWYKRLLGWLCATRLADAIPLCLDGTARSWRQNHLFLFLVGRHHEPQSLSADFFSRTCAEESLRTIRKALVEILCRSLVAKDYRSLWSECSAVLRRSTAEDLAYFLSLDREIHVHPDTGEVSFCDPLPWGGLTGFLALVGFVECEMRVGTMLRLQASKVGKAIKEKRSWIAAHYSGGFLDLSENVDRAFFSVLHELGFRRLTKELLTCERSTAQASVFWDGFRKRGLESLKRIAGAAGRAKSKTEYGTNGPQCLTTEAGREPRSQQDGGGGYEQSDGDSQALIWDSDDKGRTKVGDHHRGVVAAIDDGTAVWALLSALRAQRGSVLDMPSLAANVDCLLLKWEEDQLCTHGKLSPSGNRGKQRLGNKPYSPRSAKLLYEQFQGLARKVRGSKGKDWRSRWLHWDPKEHTVVFDYRS